MLLHRSTGCRVCVVRVCNEHIKRARAGYHSSWWRFEHEPAVPFPIGPSTITEGLLQQIGLA